MAIRAIVSDFGNVLLPFDRRREAENLVRAGLVEGLSLEAVHDIITGVDGTALLNKFEQGSITDEEFVRALEQRLGTQLPRNYFWPAHTAIFEPNQSLIELLRRLKKESGLKLVGLTNTDPYRLNYMLGMIRLPWDGVVSSCFEGAAKPHPRLFRHALDIAGVSPADALFIDDVEEYVLAARALGIQAHQYVSFDALVVDLRRLDIIVTA